MAAELYKNITIQMVGDDTSPVSADLIEKSVFLRAAFSLNLGQIIAPAADDINTEKLGHLWEDVKPVNGGFTFEIATVLPYFLPYFGTAPEYVVHVDDAELLVSSRMLRCFFSEPDATEIPLQYFLVHRCALDHLRQHKRLTHIHPVPLRTFVTKRLRAKGWSAEDVIQNRFYSWVNAFVRELSRLLDAIRAASPKDAKHLLPQLAATFLPVFWIYAEGDEDKTAIQQFAGDMPSAAFRSLSGLDDDSVQRVHRFLNSRSAIAVHESALALAATFLHYGYLGLALVQVCIACESVLAQVYESFLLARGVSKTKYAEAGRDITFSQLLNLHLAAARDLSTLPNREDTLARLNWARKCRNDVVHKGDVNQSVTGRDVQAAIEAANHLIQFTLRD